MIYTVMAIFIVAVILVSTLPVFFLDTRKYKKKLNNEEISKLEKFKKEALKLATELESIRNAKTIDKTTNKEKLKVIEKSTANVVIKKEKTKEIKENKIEETTSDNVLVFSKENIIRGLITKELLDRKRGKRV